MTSADVHLRKTPFEGAGAVTFKTVGVSPDSERIDIKTSMQYSEVDGLKPLIAQIREFVQRFIRPKSDTWNLQCTLGVLMELPRRSIF